MGNNHQLGAVYAGRFVAGLGVGQTVVVGPVYLAEIVSTAPIQRLLIIDLTLTVPRIGSRSVYLYIHRLCVSGRRPGLLCQLRLRGQHGRSHS